MTGFVAVRWGVVAASVVAAGIVGARVVAPDRWDRESDTAHLLMCLVMPVMLIVPMTAAHEAVRSLLTAMIVVYAALLFGRLIRWWRAAGPAGVPEVAALGYQLVAAGAMWAAMGGHGHGMGPVLPSAVLLVLAALFALDALLVLAPGTGSTLRHVVSHPAGFSGPVAAIPHLVMDLGSVYMLVAAAVG